MMRPVALSVLFSALALAQIDDNTLTVTSAQNVAATPDQTVLSVSVTLAFNATLDDAVKTLQTAGFAATD